MITNGKSKRKNQEEITHKFLQKKYIADKTVRGDLHQILKIGTTKNGGNVKEVMDIALEEYVRRYLSEKL